MAKLSLTVGSATLNLILLIIIGVLAGDAAFNPIRELAALRRDRIQLQTQRDRLVADNAQREATIIQLRSNDNYVRRMIHQELGYISTDELIYHFADSSTEQDSGDSNLSVSK